MPGAWLAEDAVLYFWRDGDTIPVIIVGGCWFAWRHQSSEPIHRSFCRFATHHWCFGAYPYLLWSAAINADDIWYFASGGVIGSLLSMTLQPLLHSSGIIALLCVWAAGLTLFTGWSWVTIAEKLGGWIFTHLRQ
ncbi:DNA translocase FtsK 4TM domain-containing protein [Escherichia coli]